MEVIRLDRVSLMRRTQEEFSYNLKKTVLSWLEGKFRKPARRLVLDQIDLEIEAGEKVGIIGANGSGKSTLLKVICNILEPSSGCVRVRGNIAPLIELGAGFDPEISVADNIILYGVILGFSEKEMRDSTPRILEFAELEEYSAVPVKALSSGMVARLGFAVATEVQPDILILDEVLSVGDESFRNKCKQRIEKFWHANSTVLLVSHDLDFIRKSCQRAIWLEHGKIRMISQSSEVIDAYIENCKIKDKFLLANSHLDVDKSIEVPLAEGSIPPPETLGAVVATNIFIADQQKYITDQIPFGEPFYLGIDYTVSEPIQNLVIGLDLINQQGVIVLEPVSLNTSAQTEKICALGRQRAYIKIPGPLLKPDHYFISAIGIREINPTTWKMTTHHFISQKLVKFSVVVTEAYRNEWFGQEAVHPILEWEIEARGEI